MSNVVGLPKRERLIWLCGHCGCSTWYLYSDSLTECAACGNVSDGCEWVTPIEDKPKSPEKDNGASVNIIGVGSVELAKRRVLKVINDRSGELALIAGWTSDGGMKAWSDIETAEQRDWVVRKLHELAASFQDKKFDDA